MRSLLTGVSYAAASPKSPLNTLKASTFEILGIDARGLSLYLARTHMIAVQAMSSPSRAPEIRGVRVTPNVYTSLDELDYFCEAVEKVVKQGLPKSA